MMTYVHIKTQKEVISLFHNYTISLFGNRRITNGRLAEARLDEVLSDIIATHEHTTVLIGRNGDFDLLASSVIRRLQSRMGKERCTHILVLPYPTKDLRENEAAFSAYYDEIRIDEDAAAAHFKASITVRNRNMIMQSDYVLVWEEHTGGGTSAARQFAEEQGVPTIDLHNKKK